MDKIMQPQTQISGLGNLDQDAVNMAKAIRQTESGGDFKAKGKSGEYGAYQFTEPTWNAYSQKHGINVPLNQATPEQQNEVAYKQVKEWKDAGRNVGQVASMWNAGESKPDAYLDSTYKGTNKSGAKFDVPAYAKSVATAYQTIKNGGQAGMDAQNPSSIANTENKPDDKKEGILSKIIDFAFPILKDFSGEGAKKTTLQKAGDLGLSALWFVPGLGGAASTALRGVGMGVKAAKLAGAIGTGAAVGYGADVSQKLSEGKTADEAFKPGLGTAIGAGTGGLVSRVAGKYSQKGILEGITKENNAVFGQTKRGANELAESFSKNKNPGQLAAEKGINLKQMIDPETIAYSTKDKVSEITKDARVLNETLTDALARVPGSKPVAELEQQLLAKIPKNYPERGDIVKREMELLRKQYGDNPSISDLNEWKQRNWNFGKFDMAVPSDTRLTHRMIGNTLKTEVETLAKKGGLEGVGEMNDYIGSHYDLADILEGLNGTKAKGGRLGNLMRDSALTTIGGVSGMFGGGPAGMLAGVVAGHYSSKALSGVLRKIESSPIKSAILRRMAKEDPEIVQKMLKASGKTPEELAPIKNQLKELGIDIFPEAPQKQIAPKLKAKETKPGLIQGLVTAGASRLGAQ